MRRIGLAGAILTMALFSIAAWPSSGWGWPVPRPTCRVVTHLMTIDHHLVRADLIAVLHVSMRELQMVDGVPIQLVQTQVQDQWHSRWGSLSTLDFNTSSEFYELQEGERYLVLMSGGPWEHAPFTHRENSIFHVLEDDTLRCADGSVLYGLLNDGFYCAPLGSVLGEPVTLDALRDTVLCARDRAAARLPELEASLSQQPRPLTKGPEAGSEVPR